MSVLPFRAGAVYRCAPKGKRVSTWCLVLEADVEVLSRLEECGVGLVDETSSTESTNALIRDRLRYAPLPTALKVLSRELWGRACTYSEVSRKR